MGSFAALKPISLMGALMEAQNHMYLFANIVVMNSWHTATRRSVSVVGNARLSPGGRVSNATNNRYEAQLRMEAGKVSLPWSSFLGYEKGEDGLPKIVEKEAEIVRTIYKRYLEGASLHCIAEELNAAGVETPRKKAKWQKYGKTVVWWRYCHKDLINATACGKQIRRLFNN